MGVLKKSSFPENLESFNVFVSDTLETSRYFTITDLPDTFTGGKNSFLIQGSEELVPDTIVKIEIKDAKGNVIYTEPGEGIPEYYEGVSKPVAVYVYPETAYGVCTITILGELDRYDDNGIVKPIPTEWKDKYNVRWQKTVLVNPNLPNSSKIRFYRRPKVDITETILPVYTRQVVRETISGSGYGVAVLPTPNSNLRNYRGETLYEVYATASIFSSSMENETLSVTNLNQSYTTPIRDVVNDKKLIVTVPYYETSSTGPIAPQIVKNFISGNLQLTYNKTVSFISSSLNTSYAKIKLTDLEAFSGDPARLKIFAKRKADIGNYTLLEDIQLESKEMLSADAYSGSVGVDTGLLSSQNIIDDFWKYSNYGRDAFYTKTFDNISLASSVKLEDLGTQNNTEYPQKIFYYSQSLDFTKDTEYELDFNPLMSSSLYTPNRIEVFLSGSSFFDNDSTVRLGKRVYKLEHTGNTRKYDLQRVNFKPDSDGTGRILFAVYQGNWHISNIGLRASQQTNFSPNEITLNVSLPTIVNNDEYEFKFEFYDINNNYVPIVVTKDYTFLGGSNLGNVDLTASASFLSVRPETNVFPFGYNNNYDFNEVNSFASVPIGTTQITFNVQKPGLTGDVLFTSAAYDSGGVYINPTNYSSLALPYPGFLNDITTTTPYLTVENFTGSISSIEVKRIEYTAALGGFQDIVSIFKVVEGTPGSDGTNGTQYVIRALNGTAIKNSDPTTLLEIQLTKIDGSTGVSDITSGNVKLVTGSLNTVIEVGDGITAGTNGVHYNAIFSTEKITGTLVVKAYDFDQNIVLDTITLADVTDGLSTGYIESSNGLIIKRAADNTYTPTSTALTASFYDASGNIYSQSLLLTPRYLSSNDQLKYDNGYDDSNINLDYVRTTGGTQLSAGTYVNAKGATAQFTFTEPNTNQTITISETVAIAIDGTSGSNAVQYVIRPINGTAIKNSDPTSYVEVQLTKIDGTTVTDLSSGNVKLVTGSLNTIIANGNGITAGTTYTTPYNSKFFASKINGNLVVGAYDFDNSKLVDTITLADITDGLTTGFIEATNGLILKRNAGLNTYTPPSSSLTASFYDGLGKLYTSSVLISASYAAPNDRMIYIQGITDGNITLNVKTDAGTDMSNNTFANTKSTTVKYTFIDPNTGQTAAATETIALAVDGVSGFNAVNMVMTPIAQTVRKNVSLNSYGAVVPVYIQLFETGSALTYTTSTTPSSGQFTLQINTINGTNNSVNGAKSGSITPPSVNTDNGSSSSFAFRYRDSNNNLSDFISASHYVTVVADGTDGQNVGDAGQPSIEIRIVPQTQTVTRNPANVFGVPGPYLVRLYESGTLMTYTSTDPPGTIGQWTLAISSDQGTLSYTNGATSASIQPPTPTLSTPYGISSSFAVKYKNSKGVVSQYISQSHQVAVSFDGTNGPGVVFTGIWQNGRAYQFSSGSDGRRDVVLWGRNGLEPYNTYYASLRQHTADGTTTSTGNGAPNYSTGSAGSAWQELGQESFFVAAKIGLFEDSFVRNTLNIGSSNNGGVSSANITLAGSGSYPYISLGQSDSTGSQGYGLNGIFIGAVKDTLDSNKRKYRMSLVTGSNYLKWDGDGRLLISGTISASEGRIGGVTISGSTIYTGQGVYGGSTTGFYLTSASSNIFSLGDKLTWNGSTLSVNGTINITNPSTANNGNPVGQFTNGDALTAGTIGGITIGSNAIYTSPGTWGGKTTGFYLGSDAKFSLEDRLIWDPTNNYLNVSGTIFAETGSFGGVIIGANKLYTGDGVYGGKTTGFYLGSDAKFSLEDRLVWDPTNNYLNISGTIFAETGSIGNITIGANKIYTGPGIYAGQTTGIYLTSASAGTGQLSLGDRLTWNGLSLFISGAISASAGRVGPVNIDLDRMYIGTGNYGNTNTAFFISSSGDFSLKDGLIWNSAANDLKINSGSIIITNATGDQWTKILSNGTFNSNKTDIEGKITATSGQIGGWEIVSNNLQAAPTPDKKIVINANRPSIEIYSGSAMLVDMSGDRKLSGTGSVSIMVSGSGNYGSTTTAKISSGSTVINTANLASNYSGQTVLSFTTGSTIITGSWSASFVVPQSSDGALTVISMNGIGPSGSNSASFNAKVDTGYTISDGIFTMNYGFALYSASVNWTIPKYVSKVSKAANGSLIYSSRSTILSGSVLYNGNLTLTQPLNAASYSVIPFIELVSISATATADGGGCNCPSYGTFAYYGTCNISCERQVYRYDGTCTGLTCNVYAAETEACGGGNCA